MIGDVTPEWAEEVDVNSGRRVTLLTDGRSNSYALYYFFPSVTPDGHFLVFHSERSGEVQLYRLDLASGEIGQLSDGHTKDSGWAVWCDWHVDGIYSHLSAIHPVSGEVYYFEDDQISATDVALPIARLERSQPAACRSDKRHSRPTAVGSATSTRTRRTTSPSSGIARSGRAPAHSRGIASTIRASAIPSRRHSRWSSSPIYPPALRHTQRRLQRGQRLAEMPGKPVGIAWT